MGNACGGTPGPMEARGSYWVNHRWWSPHHSLFLPIHQHRQLNNREAGQSSAWLTDLQTRTPPRGPIYVPDAPNREVPQVREPSKCLKGWSYGGRVAKEASLSPATRGWWKDSDRVKTSAAEEVIVPAQLSLPWSPEIKKLRQVHAQCSLGRSCYRPKKSCVYGYLVTSVQFSSVQFSSDQFSSVQSLIPVPLFATPWIAARQDSLSITTSRSSPRSTSIESVMASSHLMHCCPLLLLPPIPPNIRVFPNESTLLKRWPKYWSYSFSIIPPKKSQGSIASEWTGWISLQSKGLSRVFSNTTVQKHQSLGAQPSSQSNSHIHTWPQENP